MTKTQTADDTLHTLARRAAVFDWMEANKVAVLYVEFNGEGDSGNFEDYVNVTIAEDDERIRDDIERWNVESDLHGLLAATPSHVASHDEPVQSLKDLVLALACEAEQTTNHGKDWWNNEGGRGKVEFILDGVGEDGNHYRRGICLTVEERIIEYQGDSYAVCGCVDEESEQAPEAA